MGEFIVANELIDRPEELRAHARAHGYLYFQRLFPADTVLGLRRDILELCQRHGWVDGSAPLMDGVADLDKATIEGQEPFMALYDDLQRLQSFHAFAHQPALLRALEALFNDTVLVHPRNIARVLFPQNNQHTTPAHQDYIHIQGTEETYTAWIPLGDCPRALGGLEILDRSHTVGLQPAHAAYGAGGAGVETDHLGLDWHAGDLECGDVLLFQSLTIHRGTPNQTPDKLRLSVDYRYQAASEPVLDDSLLPHHGRLSWEQIYADWPDDNFKFYWHDLDLTTSPGRHIEVTPTREG